MIEDKELGLKVAENKEEVLWENVRKNSLKEVEVLEDSLTLQREITKLAETKLKELKS
jgi:hypothetical protein